MQTYKAPRLRRASSTEKRLFEEFCRRSGFEPTRCARDVYALEVPGGTYVELFDPSPDLLEALRKTIGMSVYSVGLYLGLADTTLNRFRPSLPLAHRLAPLCKITNACCILDEKGEKRFLYGRIIHHEMIIKAPRSQSTCLVTNLLGEALGWARLSVKSKNGGIKTMLIPVIDLGWYLRRGG